MEDFNGSVYGRLLDPDKSDRVKKTIVHMLSASKTVDLRPVRHHIKDEEPAFHACSERSVDNSAIDYLQGFSQANIARIFGANHVACYYPAITHESCTSFVQ